MKFVTPKIISPFYPKDMKIPRKLKKKIKKYTGCHYQGLNNGEKLWYYLGYKNLDYRNFLIQLMVKQQ